MTYRIAMVLVATLSAPVSAQAVRHKTVTVTAPWSRATSPRATIGAGYLTIRNAGAQADRLVSATSPRRARTKCSAAL